MTEYEIAYFCFVLAWLSVQFVSYCCYFILLQILFTVM